MSAAVAAVRAEAPTREDLREVALAAHEVTQSEAPNLDALWRALADGRFRLIECFERGGRRYYVLSENLEAGAPCGRLDARERRLAELVGCGESEKRAAYDLGITPSAVSAILKSTLSKLGIRSRIDLVVLVSTLRMRTRA